MDGIRMMNPEKLYFATNRDHKGDDRWHPTHYGKRFSRNGSQNLRFGELIIEPDKNKIKSHLDKGKGESLAPYLTELAKEARRRRRHGHSNEWVLPKP